MHGWLLRFFIFLADTIYTYINISTTSLLITLYAITFAFFKWVFYHVSDTVSTTAGMIRQQSFDDEAYGSPQIGAEIGIRFPLNLSSTWTVLWKLGSWQVNDTKNPGISQFPGGGLIPPYY